MKPDSIDVGKYAYMYRIWFHRVKLLSLLYYNLDHKVQLPTRVDLQCLKVIMDEI